jgi:RNA polymerase-binding transcription factor DksA
MDEMDHAQAAEELDRERALAAMRERIDSAMVARADALDGLCIDCGEEIAPARIAALNGRCERCIDCAERLELQRRGYR